MVQHLLGTRGIQRNQHPQIGQRVEQHMRLKLGLQQFEMGFCRLALRLLGLHL